MIEFDLREYLASRPSIASLTSHRVTCGPRTQGAGLPAITLHNASGNHLHNLDGSAGAARPRIQIDSWAASYQKAVELAEIVRQTLQPLRGRVGTHIVNSCFLAGSYDVTLPPRPGAQPDTYRIVQDWLIATDEPIPTLTP